MIEENNHQEPQDQGQNKLQIEGMLHGDNQGNTDIFVFVALSDAVPESSTWALLLSGLCVWFG